jgi:RNA polymerase sigma-70 factor (ECF subfamily)
VVQEAFLRYSGAPRDAIESPGAYLTTIAARLSIDRLRALKAERERYVGPWLPEPVVSEGAMSADQHSQLAETLSQAFLVLLESLDPIERAVFLLREAFDLEYDAVAQVVDRTPEHCRQLLHRARERLSRSQRRGHATREEQQRLTEQFVRTCGSGDLAGLVSMLADDAIVYTDGGGRVAAALRPIHGADRCARFLLGVTKKQPAGVRVHSLTINGRPGFVTVAGGRIDSVVQLEIVAGRIVAVFAQRNPKKLRAISVQK